MNFQAVLLPEISEPVFSKSLCNQRKALQKRAGDLNEHHASIVREKENLSQNMSLESEGDDATKPDENYGSVFHANNIKELEFSALKTEVQLRRDVSDFLKDLRLEAAEARRKATENLQVVEAEVTADLIDIGFLCPIQNKLSMSRVLPGMVRMNLRFIAAYQEKESFGAMFNGSFEKLNKTAIQNLQDHMSREREKLAVRTGVAPVA